MRADTREFSCPNAGHLQLKFRLINFLNFAIISMWLSDRGSTPLNFVPWEYITSDLWHAVIESLLKDGGLTWTALQNFHTWQMFQANVS